MRPKINILIVIIQSDIMLSTPDKSAVCKYANAINKKQLIANV